MAVLARLVPTLDRLAGAPRRGGFTRVEIMVALAMSTLVVLTAVAAFRLVGRAIATANGLSTENGLLRAGFIIALKDVDYWNSHADNGAPFSKGFTRVRARPDDPATSWNWNWEQWRDESQRKRPFSPVLYLARTDSATEAASGASGDLFNARAPAPALDENVDPFNRSDVVPNPAAFMAHDPRSIQRTHLKLNQDGAHGWWRGQKLNHQCCFDNLLTLGDFRLATASDMRNRQPLNRLFHGPASGPVEVDRDYDGVPDPQGTAATVDLAQPSTWDDGKGGTVSSPGIAFGFDPAVNQFLPLFQHSLWQRLSFYGLYQYQAPGLGVYFNDADGWLPRENSSPRQPYVTLSRAAQNYRPAFSYIAAYWENVYLYGQRDVCSMMGMNFSRAQSKALVFPVCEPMAPGGERTHDYTINRVPYLYLRANGWEVDEATNWWPAWTDVREQGYARMEAADMTRDDRSSIARTVWLPFNLTDADRRKPDVAGTLRVASLKPLDYTSKPAKAPVMSTSILRYGRSGGGADITVARVTVERPETGRKIELTFTAFGTTFRGARQHWRLYSPAMDPRGTVPAADDEDGPIGDFYLRNDGSGIGKGPYAP
jgi:hypothetical protein